jgi:hypothetical protein
MANLCNHWNDNYENCSNSEKCLHIIKKAVNQSCSCAVIKNMPMDQGGQGNTEDENRTMGLLSFPFQWNHIFVYYIKTLWPSSWPHLTLSLSCRILHWGMGSWILWPFSAGTQGSRRPSLPVSVLLLECLKHLPPLWKAAHLSGLLPVPRTNPTIRAPKTQSCQQACVLLLFCPFRLWKPIIEFGHHTNDIVKVCSSFIRTGLQLYT